MKRHQKVQAAAPAIASALAAGLVLLASMTTAAAAVMRCEGGASYSDQACAAGQPLSSPAPPSASQQVQAERVAQREQALASRLRSERLEEQRLFKPLGAAGIRDSAADARRAAEAKANAASSAKALRKVERKPAGKKRRPSSPASVNRN